MKLELPSKWIYVASYYGWWPTNSTKLIVSETQNKRPLLRFQEYPLRNLLKEL